MRISDRSSDVCSSDLFGTQQIIDVGVEIEPARPVPHAQYDRRAVMDVAECPRRLRHHCKALDLAIRIAPRPAPQTGKADRFAIPRRDIEFGLGLRSEEHTSELQSLMRISYAVFCLKKNKRKKTTQKGRVK